jgi:hypothetical protein
VSSLVFTFETGQIAFALPLADPAASALSHIGRYQKQQISFSEISQVDRDSRTAVPAAWSMVEWPMR